MFQISLVPCSCYSRCCGWGTGSYELSFDGDVIVDGGAFGASETKSFSTPASEPECIDLSVKLNFDMYPQDTRWDITQGGAVAVASLPYAAGTLEDEQELCLPSGDYVFTIYDVYQDGMCCKWGEGKYSVTTGVAGQVIKEGAEFGASESTTFSLPMI